MKTILKSVFTLGLVAGLGYAANERVSASTEASATILGALAIVHDGTPINFGTISNTSGAGVILDAKGVTNVNTGNDRSVAGFEVTGSDGVAISVNYDPTVDLIFADAADLDDLTATDIIVMTPEVVGTSTGLLAADQAAAVNITQGGDVIMGTGGVATKFYIWVGGSLATGGPYAVGVYSGIFNISVEYN